MLAGITKEKKADKLSLVNNAEIQDELQLPDSSVNSVVLTQPQGSRLSQFQIQSEAHGQTTSFSNTFGNEAVSLGLQVLTNLDQIYIKQQVEVFEIIFGCETQNRYKIFTDHNSQRHEILFAKEDTDWCTRQCCGPLRPFDMNISGMNGQELIHLTRPLACGLCCFPCCLQSIEVQDGHGELLGTVEQEWTFWTPKYVIKDSNGEPVLRILGPCCRFACCNDVDFSILTMDGETEVGKITKIWSGILREVFTDADNFGVSFPKDLDVKMKAVLLGATMLIDFMFFERGKR